MGGDTHKVVVSTLDAEGEVRDIVEHVVSSLWQKVVDAVNERLLSTHRVQQLLSGLFGGGRVESAPLKVGLLGLAIKDMQWAARGQSIHTLSEALVELGRVDSSDTGSSILLLLNAEQDIELRRVAGGWRGVIKFVGIKDVKFASTVGIGTLSPKVGYNVVVSPPAAREKEVRALGEDSLEPEVIEFLARTIMVISSPTAVKAHSLLHSAVQATISAFARLSHNLFEFEGERYAYIHHVDVLSKVVNPSLTLGMESMSKTDVISVQVIEAVIENIRLLVEFFKQDGTSLGVAELLARAKVSIDLGKDTKVVNLSFSIERGYLKGGIHVHAVETDEPITILRLRDFDELPPAPRIEFPFPVFADAVKKVIRMVCKKLKDDGSLFS